jgi:hypothetical protein
VGVVGIIAEGELGSGGVGGGFSCWGAVLALAGVRVTGRGLLSCESGSGALLGDIVEGAGVSWLLPRV